MIGISGGYCEEQKRDCLFATTAYRNLCDRKTCKFTESELFQYCVSKDRFCPACLSSGACACITCMYDGSLNTTNYSAPEYCMEKHRYCQYAGTLTGTCSRTACPFSTTHLNTFTYNSPPQTDESTAKADAGKPQVSLVPTQIIWDITEVREYGNRKYHSPDNWKTVSADRYINALLRHTLKFMEDPQSVDEESGIKHYKHMACNLAFLCELLKEDE